MRDHDATQKVLGKLRGPAPSAPDDWESSELPAHSVGEVAGEGREVL